MKKQVILLVLVALLVVLVGVQAVQINELKDDINDGTVSGASSARIGVSGGNGVSAPVRSQPTMVGGC